MTTGHRSKDPTKLRHGPNAVDPGKAIKIGDHLPTHRVEDDKLVSVHVGDLKAASCRVQTLVIEANGRPGHRHIY